MATSGYDGQTDRELAIGTANGDQRAFAALYDRHFQQVYDLAIRMLREPEAAADATQAVFEEASTGLRAGRVPEHVRAWLYAIAMGEATGRAQQAAAIGAAPLEEGRLPSLIEVDSTRRGAQGAGQDAGLRKMVWDAASRLSPREYALLDLSVRRDLGNDELAEGLGISEETASSTVSGVRRNFEQAAAVELLTHRGREACPELDGLLARSTDPGTLEDAVQAHLESCDKCRETIASYPPAAEVLSALALVPPTAGLKEVIWGNLAAPPAAAAAPPPPIVPPVEHEEGPRRPWWLWALLGAMALLGVIVAVVILLASGDDDDEATVTNPDDIRAVGLEEGDSTTETVIEMEWDAQEGVQAYSVDWTTNRSTLPDETGDLTGDATGDTSPELDTGSWYFHLRTQGDDGTWTSPDHIGPYNVVEPSPTPSPEPTEEPTEAPTAPPTEEPTAEPTTPPTPTPAPATPSPTP